MVDQALFLRTLSEFAQTLVRPYEVGDVLYDMTGRLIEVLGVTGAGVSLGEGDRIRFATGVNEASVRTEEAQEEAQQGPCVQAFRTGEKVLVSDLREVGEGWDVFREAALGAGFLAVAAIPMKVDSRSLGALNVYSSTKRAWSSDDVATATVLANMATSYIINASELEKANRTAEQLQQALESRIVIEQAKGMVAAQRKIHPDQAYRVLRQHARSHNSSLRAVADAVVNLGLRPS